MRDDRYHIPFGGFTGATFAVLVSATIAFLCLFIFIEGGMQESQQWLLAVVFLFGLAAFFYPSLSASDVKDRIPELKGVKSLKEEKIRHQYFVIILLINIFFGLTLLGWVVAFLWSLAPGDVRLPPKVQDYMEGLDGEISPRPRPNAEKTTDADSTSNDARTKSEKLDEIDALHSSGKITNEERDKMRAKALNI